jgi:hypothetical protein
MKLIASIIITLIVALLLFVNYEKKLKQSGIDTHAHQEMPKETATLVEQQTDIFIGDLEASAQQEGAADACRQDFLNSAELEINAKLAEADLAMSDQSRKRLLALTGTDSFKSFYKTAEANEEQQLRLIEQQFTLLTEEYAEQKDGFTAIRILELCHTAIQDGLCEKTLIEQLATEHHDNGYLMLYVASFYSGINDHDELAALQALIQANDFKTYRREYITSIVNVISGEGIPPKFALIAAIGIDAARWLPILSTYEYCKKHDYPEICLDVGQFLENRGLSVINESAGLNLQKFYWEAQNNHQIANEIEQRKKQRMKTYNDIGEFHLPLSDEFVQTYLSSLNYENEIESFKYLNEQTAKYIEANPTVCVL